MPNTKWRRWETLSWLAPSRKVGEKTIRFWNQLIGVALFYEAYELTSSLAQGTYRVALRNALWEVHVEQFFKVFLEASIQHVFLHAPLLIKLSNLFYVTVHFIMPVVVLVALFRVAPERYVRYRNIFAIMTAISFTIFILFPVMPPRLLPASFHFIDTQVSYGGAGELDAILMKDAGNPYAAMPSLHFAWALWSAVAYFSVIRSRAGKILMVLDPVMTAFVVVVTANHFFLDIVAGGALFVISDYLERLPRRLSRRSILRRAETNMPLL